MGLEEITYSVSINRSRTKVQDKNVNLNFHCSFSFMAMFIIWPLCIKEMSTEYVANK